MSHSQFDQSSHFAWQWWHFLLIVAGLTLLVVLIVICKKKKPKDTLPTIGVPMPVITHGSPNHLPEEPNFETMSENQFQRQTKLKIPEDVNRNLVRKGKSAQLPNEPISKPIEFDPGLNEVFIMGTEIEQMESHSDVSIVKTGSKCVISSKRLKTAKMPYASCEVNTQKSDMPRTLLRTEPTQQINKSRDPIPSSIKKSKI